MQNVFAPLEIAKILYASQPADNDYSGHHDTKLSSN